MHAEGTLQVCSLSIVMLQYLNAPYSQARMPWSLASESLVLHMKKLYGRLHTKLRTARRQSA